MNAKSPLLCAPSNINVLMHSKKLFYHRCSDRKRNKTVRANPMKSEANEHNAHHHNIICVITATFAGKAMY